MSFKLHVSKSKNSMSFYVAEAFRNEHGVSTSRIVLKLGTEKDIKEKYGQNINAKQWASDFVENFKLERKKDKPFTANLSLLVDVPYDKGENHSFNVGYIFLQKELYALGFKKMCKEISVRHQFQYDFGKILSDLIYARILDPSSKRSSYEYCKDHLLEPPNYEQHDIYRCLDVIHEETDFIQSYLYTHNVNTKRNKKILFYDCTNFYFEITGEDGLKTYGKSKEHRPNPIVQMGLFIDGDGLPLGFSIFKGSANEQPSLKPLEKRVLKDYEMADADLIVCTDAGLASLANRRFNSTMRRDFITVQSMKTMAEDLIEWCLNPGRSLKENPLRPDENPDTVARELLNTGWRVEGSDAIISLNDIDEEDPANLGKVFYKEKILVDEKKHFEQRLIVSFSIKYKRFMQRKHESDIRRAQIIINRNESQKLEVQNSKDVRKLVKVSYTTEDGKIADNKVMELDYGAIAAETRFDGFYAVCTSIGKEKMPVSKIVRINRGRWEIEESFRLMKQEFRSRPVYLHDENRIEAHFLTCFLALYLFRILEKKVNTKSPETITAPDLIKTLREMNITKVNHYYMGTYKRTDITDCLYEHSRIRFDCSLLSPRKVISAIRASKKNC